jgi:hypothetical protein
VHRIPRTLLAILAVLVIAPRAARGQDRPFVFSVTTATDTSKPSVLVDYDVGFGEQAFHSTEENGPEQRVGVQASVGRWTFLGRLGLTSSQDTFQTSQQGEALFSLLTQSSASGGPIAFAVGGGLLHEAGGVDVLLARVVAGRNFEQSRVHGNLLFQMPQSAPERDAVDVITSVGWSRRVSAAVSLGVEGIGEDLEGFWELEEAEGGARLLVGPSLHIAQPGRKWQLSIAGGPMFHGSNSARASGALRDLPATTQKTGYAVRTSFACTF